MIPLIKDAHNMRLRCPSLPHHQGMLCLQSKRHIIGPAYTPVARITATRCKQNANTTEMFDILSKSYRACEFFRQIFLLFVDALKMVGFRTLVAAQKDAAIMAKSAHIVVLIFTGHLMHSELQGSNFQCCNLHWLCSARCTCAARKMCTSSRACTRIACDFVRVQCRHCSSLQAAATPLVLVWK